MGKNIYDAAFDDILMPLDPDFEALSAKERSRIAKTLVQSQVSLYAYIIANIIPFIDFVRDPLSEFTDPAAFAGVNKPTDQDLRNLIIKLTIGIKNLPTRIGDLSRGVKRSEWRGIGAPIILDSEFLNYCQKANLGNYIRALVTYNRLTNGNVRMAIQDYQPTGARLQDAMVTLLSPLVVDNETYMLTRLGTAARLLAINCYVSGTVTINGANSRRMSGRAATEGKFHVTQDMYNYLPNTLDRVVRKVSEFSIGAGEAGGIGASNQAGSVINGQQVGPKPGDMTRPNDPNKRPVFRFAMDNGFDYTGLQSIVRASTIVAEQITGLNYQKKPLGSKITVTLDSNAFITDYYDRVMTGEGYAGLVEDHSRGKGGASPSSSSNTIRRILTSDDEVANIAYYYIKITSGDTTTTGRGNSRSRTTV